MTDAAPWVLTVMNAGGELQLSPHISASLAAWWCPWRLSDSFSLKTLALLPEGRWWPQTPGRGHFFGVHLSVAWYNLRAGDTRYQDASTPLLGCGVTYGYALPVAPGWDIQFSAGIGYATMHYDRFYNISDGARIDTRRTSYWGIDRLGVAIVYHFRL